MSHRHDRKKKRRRDTESGPAEQCEVACSNMGDTPKAHGLKRPLPVTAMYGPCGSSTVHHVTCHVVVTQHKKQLLKAGRLCPMLEGGSDTQTGCSEEEESLNEENLQVEASGPREGREVSRLGHTVRELEQLLCEEHRESERKTEEHERDLEVQRLLREQNEELKILFSQKEQLLKVTLDEAERKYTKVMEINAQVKKEKAELQGRLQEMSSLLNVTFNKCEEEKNEHEMTKAFVKFLKSEAREQEEHFIQEINSLKESLCETEERFQKELWRHEKLQEGFHKLEQEHVELRDTHFLARDDCTCLRKQLIDKQIELIETQRKFKEEIKEKELHSFRSDLLIQDYERESEDYRALMEQYAVMTEQYDKLLKEREQEQEAHKVLKSHFEQMREQLESESPKLQASLAKAERKCEQLMESNVQLEKEKSELMGHVNELRYRVRQLEGISEHAGK